MPRAVFFSNQLARKNGTGVARYAHNLLKSFTELGISFNVVPVATWSDLGKDDLKFLIADTGLRLLPTRRIATRLLWSTIGFPRLEHLLDFRFDIVHANDLAYLAITSKPFVVTVHDIGPLTHPDSFNNNSFWIMKKNLEYAIKNASAFICVSKATAHSLSEYVQARYSVDLSSMTHIVHEGISEKFFQPPDLSALDLNDQFDFLNQPFILAVGKISPRKNLEMVIWALKRLQSSLSHHLITVGGDGWDYQEVKNLASSLGIAERVHFLGYVSDDALNALYHKATLFIYPSLLEGFGLPILEAMASGCPVITSDRSSLPEIAGEAALLVDPCNLDSVVSALELVCKNESFAAELSRKGKERANQFSWRKCAEETSMVYNRLIA